MATNAPGRHEVKLFGVPIVMGPGTSNKEICYTFSIQPEKVRRLGVVGWKSCAVGNALPT